MKCKACGVENHGRYVFLLRDSMGRLVDGWLCRPCFNKGGYYTNKPQSHTKGRLVTRTHRLPGE